MLIGFGLWAAPPLLPAADQFTMVFNGEAIADQRSRARRPWCVLGK